jgi:integrase/recombinase XerD
MQMQLFELTPEHTCTVKSDESLSKCAARFMAHCRVAKSLSPHTIRAYEGDLRLLIRDLGPDVAPEEVDRERLWKHVRWLREERRLGETSVKRRLATLRVFFRWMEAEGVVPLSIFHRLGLGIRLPKRLPRALDAFDLRRLLDTVDPQGGAMEVEDHDTLVMRTAVIVLFATGLRVSELVSSRLADVSIADASILVRGKGNRERRVYLSNGFALKALEDFLGRRQAVPGQEFLFVRQGGRRVSAQFVRSRLRSLASTAGISRRVTPHMLRHTAATQLLEAGVDIRFVQRLLGHSSIATTQIYTQVTDSMLKMKLNDADTLGRARRAG